MQELEAYTRGLTAGGRYWNSGIDSGKWVIPDNPYEAGTKDAEAYDKGFWEAADDLEAAYYA